MKKEDLNLRSSKGFHHVHVNREYTPLLLDCLAIGETEDAPHGGRAKKIVGQAFSEEYKKYEHMKSYRLLVMYGRDCLGCRYFFVKDVDDGGESANVELQESEDKKVERWAYKIFRGTFLFTFDAEQFFELLKDASKENADAFFTRCQPVSKEELQKFVALIEENELTLPSKVCRRARAYAQKLRRNCE